MFSGYGAGSLWEDVVEKCLVVLCDDRFNTSNDQDSETSHDRATAHQPPHTPPPDSFGRSSTSVTNVSRHPWLTVKRGNLTTHARTVASAIREPWKGSPS